MCLVNAIKEPGIHLRHQQAQVCDPSAWVVQLTQLSLLRSMSHCTLAVTQYSCRESERKASKARLQLCHRWSGHTGGEREDLVSTTRS